MKFSKNTVFLLALNPVLMVMQFFLGYFVYDKIELVNKYHIAEEGQRAYLRNNLLGLLKAEANQRNFLLSGDTLFLNSFEQEVVLLQNDTVPEELLKDDYLQEINRLSDLRLSRLKKNMQLFSEHKMDSIKVGLHIGAAMRDSIQKMNEQSYAMMSNRFKIAEQKEMTWISTLTSLFIFIFLFNLVLMYFAIRTILHQIEHFSNLNGMLEVRNKMLTNFTFLTYHSLKEPLRHISGFLQLLQKRAGPKLNEEEIGFIEESVIATKKMESNINELRDNILLKEEK